VRPAAAERSRLEGRSDPKRWRMAATAWERLERPFDAAYARFRQGEALLAARAPRAQVATILGPAHQTAMALGAAPLRREIELLAQRGRLHLEAPVDTTTAPKAPSSPAASLGLTEREAEVLALVAHQPADRPGAVHHPQDRQHPRLKDPRQAGGRRTRRGGRDRSPPRPRQAMIRVGRGRSSSAWQRMRLARARLVR
jgi:hypothetical protein